MTGRDNMRNGLSFFIDIDGTITDYQPGALDAGNLLHGNFLFPIIRDLMTEKGYDRAEAETLILAETQENVFWCYADLIAKFGLSAATAAERFRAWHDEKLTVYDDMVELIGRLAAQKRPLYVISNNPVDGCRLKLQRAKLITERGDGCFRGIFGTDLLRGCKHHPPVWQRALELAGTAPQNVVVIGNDAKEDGAIPQSCGIGCSFILERSSDSRIRREGRLIRVNHASTIASFIEAMER